MPRAKKTTSKKSSAKKLLPIYQKLSRDKILAFLRRPIVITVIVLAFIVGAAYLLRNFFIVATVNNEPISRLQLVQDLERQYGKQALEGLVTEKLILQEAKKRNIDVSQSEVDSEIKKIESQVSQSGQSLDQLLALQGMSRQDLQKRVKVQKMVEKMVVKDITVSEKEVDEYINTNSESFTQPINKETRDSVKEQLRQSRITDKYQQWLSDLKKKSRIEYSDLFK